MRISDWSSDVCSSDLLTVVGELERVAGEIHDDLSQASRVARQSRWHRVIDRADQLQPFARRLDGQRIEHAVDDVAHVEREDRKSVVEGKRVSVRVDLGGRRIIQNKKKTHTEKQ